jgi:hypothetical protein
MPIAPVLQRFVDDELTRAPAVVERTLAGAMQLMRDAKDSASTPSERSHHFELVEGLQRHAMAFQRAFVDALTAQVTQALREQQGNLAEDAEAASGGLELMDESRVEVDIEISRAMQLIDTTAEWELRELQTFTSTLIGQQHVSAESNPFRPLAYATALWEAACVVTPVPVQRATLLRVCAGVAAGLLKNAWAAACTRLESQGVEPGIYRTVLLTPAAAVGRSPALADASKPGALASLLARMPGGVAELRLGIGGSGPAAGAVGAGAGLPMVRTAEFEQSLARLDELLSQLAVSPPAPEPAPADAAPRAKRLAVFRAALVASAGTPVERQTIELLSCIFDAMLADPRVQPKFHAVLARMQASALRVGLREPSMMESHQHAVWLLFDRIGEVSAGHPRAGDPRGAALLLCCHALAEELARAAAPDGALYRRALNRLDAVIAEQVLTQLREAEATVAALRVAEKREIMEQHLSRRLVDQMVPLRTTPVIRRFITGAWAKVMADAILQRGEDDETTRGYIKLVDQLLWSVQLPDHPQSRQRLVTLLPGMLQRLRSGMASIGLPAAEQEAVMNELMAVHTEALRPGARGGTGLSADDIVQRMRDEVLPETTGPMTFSDSVIDLSSLETVPADVMQANATTAHTDDPAKRIEALRSAQRLRLFVRGRWACVQLLWRSDQSLFFLFAGERQAHTHSITRRALERLASAGLMLPLESRTLVQRALDGLMREQART